MIIPNNLTLNQAAKATGKSKGTISKALNEGRLSFLSKDESGYKIDPSELNRVFPLNTSKMNTSYQVEPHIEHQENTSKTRELELLLKAEQQEKIIYQKQLLEKDITIEDYRNRLTKAEDTLHRQTLLLTDNRTQKPAEAPLLPPATPMPKSQTRLSSGQIFAVFLGVLLVALLVLLWPDVMARFNGTALR